MDREPPARASPATSSPTSSVTARRIAARDGERHGRSAAVIRRTRPRAKRRTALGFSACVIRRMAGGRARGGKFRGEPAGERADADPTPAPRHRPPPPRARVRGPARRDRARRRHLRRAQLPRGAFGVLSSALQALLVAVGRRRDAARGARRAPGRAGRRPSRRSRPTRSGRRLFVWAAGVVLAGAAALLVVPARRGAGGCPRSWRRHDRASRGSRSGPARPAVRLVYTRGGRARRTASRRA